MGQSIPTGPFRIFSKIRGDIRAPPVSPVSTTLEANFANSFASVVDTDGCRLLKVHLKAKIYVYVNSTTQIYLIEDVFHLPPVSTTPVVHLEPRISQQIFEKN
jgi:hypothetical protein